MFILYYIVNVNIILYNICIIIYNNNWYRDKRNKNIYDFIVALKVFSRFSFRYFILTYFNDVLCNDKNLIIGV